MERLSEALDKHPPFDEYQPGQMRRWLWSLMMTPGEIRERDYLAMTGLYVRVDDYTRDIDLPEHVAMLPTLSELAAQDDLEHGVTW
jgi:hypothetical protein